jgi:hypothetical protein
MNSINQQLERLLKSAARAPRRPLPREAPFVVEAKVLARWRSLPGGAVDLAHVLLPLLRRAALCACLLMLLSIAFSYRAILAGENDEVTLANAAVDLTLLP